MGLRLSISNGFVSSKIYDKRDGFGFGVVDFPFLDGGVPRSASYGVYISQLIRFAGVSSHVVDFGARNGGLTARLLQWGCRCHKLRGTFSKFYRRHYELVSKFNVGLKALLHQGLSGPEFYGDLVYKFKKIIGRADFSDRFRKIIVRYKRARWWPRHGAIYFSWFGPRLFCLLLGPPGFNCWFSSAPVFQWCCSTPRDLQVSVATRFCRVLIFASS